MIPARIAALLAEHRQVTGMTWRDQLVQALGVPPLLLTALIVIALLTAGAPA